MCAEIKYDFPKPQSERRTKAQSEETEQRRAEAEGRRKENTQCTSFLNSCSPVLKSPSSCDFLPLLHRTANAVFINCTGKHMQTHCTLCTRTLVAYARVVVYTKRSHERFVGAGWKRGLRSASEGERQRKRRLHAVTALHGKHLNYISPTLMHVIVFIYLL